MRGYDVNKARDGGMKVRAEREGLNSPLRWDEKAGLLNGMR